MKIGFLEPHLRVYGGIRRILEFSNRLVDRGHDVTIYVPESEPLGCDWMPCRARVRHVPSGFRDDLDVLVFNHEPQWYLIDLFENARRRVFYALHYGASYNKEGSWEALRAPVDSMLANSTWTAEQIEAEIGRRPAVVLGGVNPEHFRLVGVSKRYPLLTVGDRRSWKGTDTVERAARLAGVPLATYAHKKLPQDRMAGEYGAAEVFVVGSRTEGFGQPGLEALACGTPLVTTDNGGCREYAIHEETALVVPPDSPEEMAAAIRRIRSDPELARRLRGNGLRIVAERFDWETNTDHLVTALERVVAEPAGGRRPLPSPADEPLLSVVVLAWDQLPYTQRCIETLRRHTDVPYELIVVDNGSSWDARHYAEVAADVPVLHERNAGFAAGMNAGLATASGQYVAFCNNDTEFPAAWASRLLDSHRAHPAAGISVPAVTEAHNGRTVRQRPGSQVEVLGPFEPVPAAVVYLMEASVARELGGFGEEYRIASGEDVDLAFKVWVNDLDIVFDERVLVQHVGKGTAAVKLPDWRRQWAANADVFLTKWTDPDSTPPRLDSCSEKRFVRNVATARSVAAWMRDYYRIRERSFPGKPAVRALLGMLSRWLNSPRARALLRPWYRRLAPHLPSAWRRRIERELVSRF
ncbi:MAG: glycosyltransferase [Actinomycetota bacterium]